MSQEMITLISALAGFMVAAGGLYAAHAARSSAVIAQEAAKHAERVDRRGLLRDLITTAHRLIAESMQVGSLIEELKTEYQTLARFSGQAGGSREKLLIQRAESKQKELFRLKEEAEKLIEKRAHLLDASEEDFTQALTKFDGYLVQVFRIKDSLQREVAAVAGDNRIHRDTRIKSINQRM
jgi:DNA repair exonuclease SbcCD ATPase subunit